MARERIAEIMGQAVVKTEALHGGCIAQVYRMVLADGQSIVVKVADAKGKLTIEGAMLRYLHTQTNLPIPAVLYCDEELLLMDYIEGTSRFGVPEQEHAAELLAGLHGISAPEFGLTFDTLIGSLDQPNPLTAKWVDFFAEHRLIYMAHVAMETGRLDAKMMKRIEAFSGKVGRWLHEPAHPSLIHGDMWTTNILARDGRIVGLIDPAIYYAHPEIELAFSTLFGTFDAAFFRRYRALRPIEAGFFEERRDIYNVYPLLVHVRLFGGGYASSVDAILRRFGF